MSLRKIKTLEHGITIHQWCTGFDTFGEYEVRVKGNPAATYFTDDKADAINTAQYMCSEAGRGALQNVQLFEREVVSDIQDAVEYAARQLHLAAQDFRKCHWNPRYMQIALEMETKAAHWDEISTLIDEYKGGF